MKFVHNEPEIPEVKPGQLLITKPLNEDEDPVKDRYGMQVLAKQIQFKEQMLLREMVS